VSAEQLAALLKQRPSADVFAEIVHVLDEWPDAPDAAISTAAAVLESWPDEARQPPADAWRRIQDGEAPPAWWPLVRHVRAGDDDTLDLGPALDPITSVDASGVQVDLSPLVAASRLRTLNFSGNDRVDNLDFVSGTPELESLHAAGISWPPDFSPLTRLSALSVLDVSFNPELEDIDAVASLVGLQRLDISGDRGLIDLSPLESMRELHTLVMERCEGVRSLEFLRPLKRLRTLAGRGLNGVSDLGPLRSTRVETLHIGGHSIGDVEPVCEVGSLLELSISDVPRVSDLSCLAKLRGLRRLGIVGCRAGLPALDAPTLRHLLIANCPVVSDLSGLGPLTALTELLLERLPVRHLGSLSSLRGLESLALRYCPHVSDLRPLAALPLRVIDITGSNPDLDTSMLPPGCRIVR
jgi:Leucine-rich repeat (LRR) protein